MKILKSYTFSKNYTYICTTCEFYVKTLKKRYGYENKIINAHLSPYG